jgi:uridine phosphorylase
LIVSAFERELQMTGQEVFRGKVWTTDAPYRETIAQLNNWAGEGVLAVEMQAASLFAFAIARQASVGYVAMVSNAVDHAGEQFDTGSMLNGVEVLRAIARASRTLLGDTE